MNWRIFPTQVERWTVQRQYNIDVIIFNMSDNEEDGPRLQDEADVGNTRPVRATKLTENGKSFKLEQYYGMFRKLKTSVTRIKKLMFKRTNQTQKM